MRGHVFHHPIVAKGCLFGAAQGQIDLFTGEDALSHERIVERGHGEVQALKLEVRDVHNAVLTCFGVVRQCPQAG